MHLDDVLLQSAKPTASSTAVQIYAHLCCCVHVFLKAGGKHREIMEIKREQHGRAASSIKNKDVKDT